MPQHGFARCNSWTIVKNYDDEDSAGISLSLNLKDVTNARGDNGNWAVGGDFDCMLTMEIKVQASSLTTSLSILNTGENAFDFQTLFHTYYLVNDHQALNARECNVSGLEGYVCEDKISGESYIMGSTPIVIDSNVDHIYTPPEGKDVVDVTIRTGGETSVSIQAYGFVDGEKVPTSCVVWK